MRRFALGFSTVMALGACGDDAAVAGGTDTDGTTTDAVGSTSGTATSGVDEGTDETMGADGESGESGEGYSSGESADCSADDDCADGNACTLDVCSAGSCEVAGPVQSTDCRPSIEVEFPPRAATLDGPQSFEVTGTVSSGAGAITSLTLNGDDVTVAADGTFSHMYTAQTGGNILVFETADSFGVTRRRVQSFLWSPSYQLPTTPNAGITDEGLALYLDQVSLDDGDHALPPNDVATVLATVLDSIDLSQFVDPGTPITSSAGYNIYLTTIDYTSTDLALTAIDGGIHLDGALQGVSGDLVFDCTIAACQLAGGDGTGDMTITSVSVDADLLLSVDGNHQLVVTTANTDTTVTGLNISSNNGWTNFLITVIEPFIIGGIVADIESELTSHVGSLLGPALSQAFNGLTPATTLSFPNLADPAQPIEVDLVTDFYATDFHDGAAPPNPSPPDGGVIMLRGGAYAAEVVAPYENLGIPDRFGCGSGGVVDVPRTSPLEIGLTDDLLNQLLFGAWRGGLLEIDLPSDQLGGGGLVEDLQVHVSGMLAPTASDCGPDGEVRVHLGDLRIDASLVFNGNAVSFVAYSSLLANLEFTPTGSGAEITIADVESIETELTVDQDASIAQEPAFVQLLETQLVDGVIGSISEAGLGAIEIPTVDISGDVGLPPGTVALTITTEAAVRAPGVTVIEGHL